ncbi:hypothetical protein IFM89_003643 [Coptis chinensis]|uniref:protein-tyrosine-phosphatase n=1 Tax=Coptis chinensis TaxID=261450 RepID=A0A835MH79_9MAGN|nr:hypothetical protein IFM89_003643 [Coptis chinensis]
MLYVLDHNRFSALEEELESVLNPSEISEEETEHFQDEVILNVNSLLSLPPSSVVTRAGTRSGQDKPLQTVNANPELSPPLTGVVTRAGTRSGQGAKYEMDDSEGSSINPRKRAKVVSNDTIEQQKKIMNVYIWDMDETLILLKSLLNGTYAQAFSSSKDIQKGKGIAKKWEDYILQLCDEHFFYEQIENYNNPFLDALSAYDDGQELSNYDFSKDGLSPPLDDFNKRKLAYRHRVVAQKYSKGLHSIINQEMMKSWDDLYELTDIYTDGWLSSARAFLEQSSGGKRVLNPQFISVDEVLDSADISSKNINLLVTSGSLIPSLVKCMLFRLDDLLEHQNVSSIFGRYSIPAPIKIFNVMIYCQPIDSVLPSVYSSLDVGKLQCFSCIKERFSSPNVRFCVIGDGWEECEAAQSMGWPFLKIDFQPGDFTGFQVLH